MIERLISLLADVLPGAAVQLPLPAAASNIPRLAPGAPFLAIPSRTDRDGGVRAKDGNLIGEFEKEGLHAVAWYEPFHFRIESWGVHLRADRVHALAEWMFGGEHSSVFQTPLTMGDRVLLALQFAIDHALFHYWTELACLQMELIARRPLYKLLAKEVGRSLGDFEEGLADARAWRRAVYQRRATEILSRNPDHRSGWRAFRDSEEFRFGKARLAADILALDGSPLVPGPFDWLFDEHHAGALTPTVPLWWERHGGEPAAVLPSPLSVTEAPSVPRGTSSPIVDAGWNLGARSALVRGRWARARFEKLMGVEDLYQCRADRGYWATLKRTGGKSFELVELSKERPTLVVRERLAKGLQPFDDDP